MDKRIEDKSTSESALRSVDNSERVSHTGRLAGNMGNTVYISGSVGGESVDAKKPRSETRLFGSIGDVEYLGKPQDAMSSENGVIYDSRVENELGSKCDSEKNIKERGGSRSESKLSGRIGCAEYGHSKTGDGFENRTVRSSRLIGSCGSSLYEGENIENQAVPEKADVIDNGLCSSTSGVHDRTVSEKKHVPYRKSKKPKGRAKGLIIGLASVLATIAIIVAIWFKRNDFSDTERMQAYATQAIQSASSFESEAGTIREEDSSNAIEAVFTEAASLGVFKTCTKDEFGVYMETDRGLDFVYCPKIVGLDSGGNDLEIVTLAPFDSQNRAQAKTKGYNHDLDAADSVANTLESTDSRWHFNKTANLDDNEVTFERILSLSNYGVILWHGHGGYNSKSGYYLCTNIVWTEELQRRYSLNKQTAFIYDGKYIGLRPAFFEEHYSDGAFENAFIYLATCFSGKEKDMAQVLINKGAAIVIVNSESIERGYNLNMMHLITESFFAGSSGTITNKAIRTLGSQYSFTTQGNWYIEDSLQLAKTKYGSKDPHRIINSAEVYYVCKNMKGYTFNYNTWMAGFGKKSTSSQPVTSIAPVDCRQLWLRFVESKYPDAALAFAADVTHDGIPECIVVMDFEDKMEVEGYVWRLDGKNNPILIHQRGGGYTHAQGFFDWFLRCSDTEHQYYDLGWYYHGFQEEGSCEWYYLSQSGDKISAPESEGHETVIYSKGWDLDSDVPEELLLISDKKTNHADTDPFEGWRTFKRAMKQTGFFSYEEYTNTFCDAYGEPIKMGWSDLVNKIHGSGMTGGAYIALDMEPESYEYYGAISGEELVLLSIVDVIEACYSGSFYDLTEADLADIWPDVTSIPAFDYTGSQGRFFLFNDSAAADRGYEKLIRQLRENDNFSPELTRNEERFRFAVDWCGDTVSGDFDCVFKIDNVVISFHIDDPTPYFYQYLTEGICTFYGVGDEGVWACD